MYALAAIGFFVVVGLVGAATGFLAQPTRAKNGALTTLGAAVLTFLTGIVGSVVDALATSHMVAGAASAQRAEALGRAISLAMWTPVAASVAAAVLGLLGILALRRASSLTAPRGGI